MADPKSNLLVVDDDLRLRDVLLRYLTDQGFGVQAVQDGRGVDRVLEQERVDVLVLDLMLPGEDGLSICRRLRAANNDIGIVILTAKGDDVDRIVGLEIGADDYLAKPFNPRELVARINAVLRRRKAPVPGAPLPSAGPILFGSCALDLTARTLTRDGLPIQLTTGEFALLKVLVDHPHQPLSREKLMELARGRDREPFDRVIDVQVSRLRKLIEERPSAPRFIQTVWGVGYVFVPDGAQ
ncbi:MAG TPA: two-component system response regulator OmpR [Burkholderiales bacterium]|nr:two-component system response regulator OmpR [Burkholderiales bacterium]